MNEVFLPGGSCFYALGGGKTQRKARGERQRVYRYEERIRAVSCTKGGKRERGSRKRTVSPVLCDHGLSHQVL